MSLWRKWVEGTLTQEEVKAWAKQQSETRDLDEKELDHVAMCLHHLFLWHRKDYPIGHFLMAVVENDFMLACGRADSTNSRVLPIYAKFLFNCAPGNWREKAKQLMEGNV